MGCLAVSTLPLKTNSARPFNSPCIKHISEAREFPNYFYGKFIPGAERWGAVVPRFATGKWPAELIRHTLCVTAGEMQGREENVAIISAS